MTALTVTAEAEIIPPGERMIRCVAAIHPFKVSIVDREYGAGTTIAEMVRDIQPIPELRQFAFVAINGQEIDPINWHRVRPKPGTLVNIRMLPSGGDLFGGGGGGDGGKNPLAALLSIATIGLSIAFPGAAPFIQLGAALLQGVLGFLSPQPKPKLPTISGGLLSGGGTVSRDSPTVFLSGARNDARPYGVVPQALGRHRMTPPLAALTYTEVEGDDQFLRMALLWSTDEVNVSDLTVKETPLDQFEGVETETAVVGPGLPPLTLFSNDVFEEVLEVQLEQASGWQLRTSQLDADELSVDITFPRGLVRFDSQARKNDRTVAVDVQYSSAGAGIWTSAGTITATARQTSAVRKSLRWTVDTGQYGRSASAHDGGPDRHPDGRRDVVDGAAHHQVRRPVQSALSGHGDGHQGQSHGSTAGRRRAARARRAGRARLGPADPDLDQAGDAQPGEHLPACPARLGQREPDRRRGYRPRPARLMARILRRQGLHLRHDRRLRRAPDGDPRRRLRRRPRAQGLPRRQVVRGDRRGQDGPGPSLHARQLMGLAGRKIAPRPAPWLPGALHQRRRGLSAGRALRLSRRLRREQCNADRGHRVPRRRQPGQGVSTGALALRRNGGAARGL